MRKTKTYRGWLITWNGHRYMASDENRRVYARTRVSIERAVDGAEELIRLITEDLKEKGLLPTKAVVS